MSKSYRLVVFDWEGTLSDTFGLVLNCVADVAQQLNFGEVDKKMVCAMVDLGLVYALKKSFPHLTEAQLEQLFDTVEHELISRHGGVFLIPGARMVVEKLHEKKVFLAIASNKAQQGLQRALHLSGIEPFFEITCCPSTTIPPKPAPKMLEHILDYFDVAPEDALMIGDTVNDIDMAKKMNVDAVGIDFYHQNEESLRQAGAVAVFDNYQAVANYLHLSL